MIDLSTISKDFPSWRPCPFRADIGYRVLRDFQSADWPFGGNGATWPFDGKGATINAGQILIFMFESWSYYYGTGFYLFRDATGEICAWDVRDDEDISRWRQFFEEESKDHG